MKRNLLLVLTAAVFLFSAFTKQTRQRRQTNQIQTTEAPQPDPTFSRFIPMDSANKMIVSYLNSINYTEQNNVNDTDLRALVIDMDQLRSYTDSNGNQPRIKHLKLFFGHTLEYINSGKANHYAGYRSGALTLIVAGYDTAGNYVYYDVNKVLEYAAPCPNSCPNGAAGQAFLSN